MPDFFGYLRQIKNFFPVWVHIFDVSFMVSIVLIYFFLDFLFAANKDYNE